jgi:soluble lytic murein transglycosylase-like protein
MSRFGRFTFAAVLAAVLPLVNGTAKAATADTGPAGDRVGRWEALTVEAAERFGIPAAWIRDVMRVESGGLTELAGQPITSSAGAMGLMQVMPRTYDALRRRYGLGSDPYDPHDNIWAGAAYLRELYDRYGYPDLFAAYNAGPGRLDAHLVQGRALPSETQAYVAMIAGAAVQPAYGRESRWSGGLFFALGATSAVSPAEPRSDPQSGTALFIRLSAGG